MGKLRVQTFKNKTALECDIDNFPIFFNEKITLFRRRFLKNKTGTSKVGTISKAQKAQTF